MRALLLILLGSAPLVLHAQTSQAVKNQMVGDALRGTFTPPGGGSPNQAAQNALNTANAYNQAGQQIGNAMQNVSQSILNQMQANEERRRQEEAQKREREQRERELEMFHQGTLKRLQQNQEHRIQNPGAPSPPGPDVSTFTRGFESYAGPLPKYGSILEFDNVQQTSQMKNSISTPDLPPGAASTPLPPLENSAAQSVDYQKYARFAWEVTKAAGESLGVAVRETARDIRKVPETIGVGLANKTADVIEGEVDKLDKDALATFRFLFGEQKK